MQLLSMILQNLLNNLSEAEKYGNLNSTTIHEKFTNCTPALKLLYTAGFKESDHGKRLIWTYNNQNIKLLNDVHDSLAALQNDQSIKEFNFEQAMDAINLSNQSVNASNEKEEKKQQEKMNWNCEACTFENQSEMNLCAMCGAQRFNVSHNKSVKQLINMGFQKHDVLIAMQLSNNDLNVTIQTLLNKSLNLSQIVNQQKSQNMHKSHANKATRIKPNSVCILTHCQSMKRLKSVLRIYHASTDLTSDHHCNKTLIRILDDFHHLLQIHEAEFEEIYNQLIISCNNRKSCVLSACYMFRRNRTSLRTNDNELKRLYFNFDDVEDIALQQILDTIHCHFFHSFDIGYKISQHDNNQIVNNNELKENNIDHDHFYNKLIVSFNQHIQKKKHYHKHQSNKFSTLIDRPNDEIKYSFGWRFFYWSFYIDNNQTMDPAVEQYIHKINANEGYCLGDFFVKAKHKNLKDELTNNANYTISLLQWHNLTTKAAIHLKTQIYQQKVCDVKDCERIYDIKQGTIITIVHLVAMMTYCNMDDFQTRFTETFRKNSPNETIECIMARHSNYAHLGRLLRECVECFGTSQNNSEYCMKSLFHGMTIESQFSSVFSCIKGPLSTSTAYAVACSFCAHKGMILEFQIDNWYLDKLRLFDCKYISDFTNEQEVFFIGGYHKLSFQTIINAPQGYNYANYVKPLTDLSNFCSASHAIDNYDANMHIGANYKIVDSFTKLINNILKQCTTTSQISYKQLYKQVCLRILSDQLYRHYGEDKKKKYYEFKNMPRYVRDLACRQFANIEFIFLFDFDYYHVWRILFEKFFFYANGWLNLDVLTTIFPSLKKVYFFIFYESKNDTLLRDESIYDSVLNFLLNQPNTKLKMIEIKIPDGAKQKVMRMIKQFDMEFRKLNWMLYIEGKCIVMKSKNYDGLVLVGIPKRYKHRVVNFLLLPGLLC